MFKFLRSGATPLPLRIPHLLQVLVIIPAFPFFLFCLVGLMALSFALVALVQFSWIFSSFSNAILLYKERSAMAKGKLTKRRYLHIQLLKLLWTVLFFAPIFIARLATNEMKLLIWMIIHVKTEWEWRTVLCFNGLHWFFIITSLLYGAIFFKGQTEGTIRLRTDEPIGLDIDSSTANDEAIARQLQANEPKWDV